MTNGSKRAELTRVDWGDLIPRDEWARMVDLLELSPGQASLLWHALDDPREETIAQKMNLTPHGAHAHRMAVFRKLDVESMPAAVARVFATYIRARRLNLAKGTGQQYP
jgi:DNA-binding CsgD family transcriptional regulator